MILFDTSSVMTYCFESGPVIKFLTHRNPLSKLWDVYCGYFWTEIVAWFQCVLNIEYVVGAATNTLESWYNTIHIFSIHTRNLPTPSLGAFKAIVNHYMLYIKWNSHYLFIILYVLSYICMRCVCFLVNYFFDGGGISFFICKDLMGLPASYVCIDNSCPDEANYVFWFSTFPMNMP